MSSGDAPVNSSHPIRISSHRYRNDLDLVIVSDVLSRPVRRGITFYHDPTGVPIETDKATNEKINRLLREADDFILVARGPRGLPLRSSGLPVKNFDGILVWATNDPTVAAKAQSYLMKYQDWMAVSTRNIISREIIERFCYAYELFPDVNIALIPPDGFSIMYAPIPSSHEYHLGRARELITKGLLPIVSVPLLQMHYHCHAPVVRYFLIRTLDRYLRQYSVLPGVGGTRWYHILFTYVQVVKTSEKIDLIFPAISLDFAKKVAACVQPYFYSYTKVSTLEYHLSLTVPSLLDGGMCVWEGESRPTIEPSISLEGKNTEEPISLMEFSEMSLGERFNVVKCGSHLYSYETLSSIVKEPKTLPLDRLPLNPHLIRTSLYFSGIIAHHSKIGIIPSELPHVFPFLEDRYYVSPDLSISKEEWTQTPYYMSGQIGDGDMADEDGIIYENGTPIIPSLWYHTLNVAGMSISFVGESDITKIKEQVHENLRRGMGMPMWRYFYPQTEIPHYLPLISGEDHGVTSDYVVAALTSTFP